MARTRSEIKKWFPIGLLGIMLAAPNATVIKYSTASLDPFFFNAIRFGLLSLVTLPYVFKYRQKLSRQNFVSALLVGVFMSVAVITYVWAIKTSQASYVSIITLLTPIIFIIYSIKLTGDKISRQAVAGITLAALGAFTVVALPIALSQKAPLSFPPLATGLALLNTLTFPLAIIFAKKSNDQGLPLLVVMCISSWVVFLTNAVFVSAFHGWNFTHISHAGLAGIVYSGLVVALLSRILNIASYEHLGAAISSSLGYTETLVAVVLPVILLGEKLSLAMVIGGAGILVGVYLVEHHRSPHHKQYQLFKAH